MKFFLFTLVEGDPKREPQAWLDTIQRDSFRFCFFNFFIIIEFSVTNDPIK